MLAVGLSAVSIILIWYVVRTRTGHDHHPVSVEEEVQLRSLFEKVGMLLVEQSYFLNKQIKLTDLAEELGCNERDLSRAINRYGGGNFNKFINSFRVAHARELLQGGKHDHYTIEAIAEESGFSNKVSFYNAFKCEFGVSPSQVRSDSNG